MESDLFLSIIIKNPPFSFWIILVQNNIIISYFKASMRKLQLEEIAHKKKIWHGVDFKKKDLHLGFWIVLDFSVISFVSSNGHIASVYRYELYSSLEQNSFSFSKLKRTMLSLFSSSSCVVYLQSSSMQYMSTFFHITHITRDTSAYSVRIVKNSHVISHPFLKNEEFAILPIS